MFQENTKVLPAEKYLSLMVAKQSAMLWSTKSTGPMVVESTAAFAVSPIQIKVVISCKRKINGYELNSFKET
jgi:hypothetical protein